MKYLRQVRPRRPWPTVVALAALLLLPLALSAGPPQIPWLPGMAVATCRSGANGINDPIVGIYDVRDPDCRAKDAHGGSLKGKYWPLPGYFNKVSQSPSGLAADEWTRANICDNPTTHQKETDCQIFGIALDDAAPPNIWVTTTALYQDSTHGGLDPYNGSGQVIRLDGTTGKITHAIFLPTSGKGLGNIAFNPIHQDFFVTNPNDAKLYHLTLASDQMHLMQAEPPLDLTQFSVADPANPPLAVAILKDRVFFSVWNLSSGAPNVIYSVGLDTTGDFDLLPPVKEIERANSTTLQTAWPPLPGSNFSYPVTDIEFSPDGQRILFAERTQSAFKSPGAHQSRVFEAERVGGVWVATPHTGPNPKFQIGMLQTSGEMANAAGGIDYNCGTTNECNLGGRQVMATGDYLLGSPLVYGFEIMSAAVGGDFTTAYNIDLDGITNSTSSKTEIGDVDVYRDCGCLTVGQENVRCSRTKPGQFVYTFDLTNLSNLTGQYVYVTSETPGVNVSPHVISLGTHPIGNGQTATGLQVTITGATSGQKVCLRISLQTRDHRLCCAKTVCLTMPDCCLEFLKRSFVCLGNGQAKLTFNFRSLTPWGTSGHLFLDPTAPLSGGVPLVTASPDYFPLNLPFGGTYTNSTILSGTLLHNTQVCLDFTIHNPSLELCCSQQLCLPWPCAINP